MATAPLSPPDPHYKPKPRYGHCSALVEGKWITYGGVGADGGLADPPTTIDVFDPDREEWIQMITSGTPPSGVAGAACVAVGPLLYHIGGMDKGCYYNTVHCLDTTTMEWRELQPANPQAAPMKKSGLAVISYGNIIVTVGGFGDLPTNRHPGVEYVPRPEREGVGWTNEVVCYDTEQNMWFRPTITGSPPPACQWCSLTRVDHHRAILFGGEKDDEPISPNVYILDMNHWTWTVIPASQTPNHPVARNGHSSISVYDPDADPTHPALLIMWGDGGGGRIPRDSWVFHLNQRKWKKVMLPETLKGHAYHTSVVIHSSPKIRIICFGALHTYPEDGDFNKAVPIAQTTMVELSCSGGHPAEWIVTDVSQLGEGDRLPTHIKLTMEEEMRHLTICERIMSEKGEVNLNFALCLLNGPPRVGKSTFLSRITGRPLPHSANDEYLISETPSTGVAERVLQVVIKKSSFTIALAPQPPKPPQASRSEINWQIVTLSQEAVIILKAILSSRPSLALEQLESQLPLTSPSDLVPTSSEGLSSEATSTTAAETNRQAIAVEPKMDVISRLGLFNFGKRKKSPPRIPGYQVPLEVFQKALKSKEWASAEEFLKHALNLYFTDVGGQPEFQEVLPAIIAGPSIFFIVFKLPDSLNQKYKVQYVESVSKKSFAYESSFTVLESILQSLASIASMCSHMHVSRDSSRLVPIKPKVVLVGTHKDQADAKHIRNVQRELKEHLLTTDHVREGIIQFASEDEPALTINNFSDDETDVMNIRHIVEEIAHDPAFTVRVPAPWLALLLSLRLIESSMISYDDSLSMAKDCGIDSDEELKEALWFLHTKLGVIRYFGEIPELSDVVICDPQLIFDKITTLISHTFTFEETRDVHVSKEFQEKGIFPVRIIDEISSRSNEPLSRKQLVILLKHLRIIAPIYDDDQQQESETPSRYIVPCVLAHAREESTPSSEESTNISVESTPSSEESTPSSEKSTNTSEESTPSSRGRKRCKITPSYKGRKISKITQKRAKEHTHCSTTESAPVIPSVCILFKCGYCPKGMFGALIADLMSPAGTRLRWRPQIPAMYRDQASFHVGPEHHIVKITFFISFLEVCISADTDHARSAQQSNAKAVCNKIRRELEQSLVSVSRTLNYGPGAGIYFGFHCSCSVPAKCDEENPVIMKCDRCGLTTDLQDTHKLWFGEEVHVSIDDLQKILSAAWEARAKWYNIGLQLKIGAGTLDAIERDSHSIDDQFRSMLSTWLRRDQPRPTLSLLANALHSPTVGHQHLAQQILAQY